MSPKIRTSCYQQKLQFASELASIKELQRQFYSDYWQRAIAAIEFIDMNGFATAKQIGEYLHIYWRNVFDQLALLESAGFPVERYCYHSNWIRWRLRRSEIAWLPQPIGLALPGVPVQIKRVKPVTYNQIVITESQEPFVICAEPRAIDLPSAAKIERILSRPIGTVGF